MTSVDRENANLRSTKAGYVIRLNDCSMQANNAEEKRISLASALTSVFLKGHKLSVGRRSSVEHCM